MTFKASADNVTLAKAEQAADELEKVLGEIANGKRKADRIPVQEIVTLIQFARNVAADTP